MLAGSLDAQTTNYYNISCLINDGYLDSVGEYIELYVLNVNEPPQFNEQFYSCTMYESKVTLHDNIAFELALRPPWNKSSLPWAYPIVIKFYNIISTNTAFRVSLFLAVSLSLLSL